MVADLHRKGGNGMAIVLRWREEPFECEFRDARSGGMLPLHLDGDIVWKEPVPSAAAAYIRAREARDELVPHRAKRA